MSGTTTSTAQVYAVYLTAASGGNPAGCVVNNVLWDGTASWTPPAGTAAIADPGRRYPIGSGYGTTTDYVLTGPDTAVAAEPVTLSLKPGGSGPQADVTVTLSDGGAGGTFSSGTVTFGADVNTTRTVTYTPKAAGTVTISATNNGSLTNPASLTVTVAAAATS
ncbi:hypothetical protein [Komagataeibacter europaeus]|uniref:hypothetical protein n=1 Tax=Komagataeibacter europaeus TaxID=33995 RepID=UPI00030491A3|nr:hypothetical protein [Komagataeibacter europaeus]GBQ38901.1 hypothetical protein AA18890_0292 [Komagataeibacter europaeus LMG 18890]